MIRKHLRVPLIERISDREYKMMYTNRFLVYHFDGEVFRYRGQEAAPWLHSSLKDYQNTVLVASTQDYLIQIDALKDGSFRYASWKNAYSLDNMSRKPDLVIGGGIYKKRNGYLFKNKTYTYIVSLEDELLTVKNNDKTILNQALYP